MSLPPASNASTSSSLSSNVSTSSESQQDTMSSSMHAGVVVAGCFCTSFEQNMYRPQICLACFHKKSEHSNLNNACGWRNVPKAEVKRTITRRSIQTGQVISSPFSTLSPSKPEPTITPLNTVSSGLYRRISSDNPPPLISPPSKLTPTKPDTWITRSYSKTHSGSTSQPNLNRPGTTLAVKSGLSQGPASPRIAGDSENGATNTVHSPTNSSTNLATPPNSPPNPSNSTASPASLTNILETAATSRNQHPVQPPTASPHAHASSVHPPSTASVVTPPPQTSPVTPSNTIPSPKILPKNIQRNAVVLLQAKNYAQEYSALQNFDAAEACSRMIRNLIWMNGVSVDEKFVREFLVKLDTETIKHRPTVAWERRHLRDQALLGMSIRHDIEHVLRQQSQLHKIVIVQSCMRRYLVKKKVTKLKQYQQSPYRERNNIFRDILRGERGYVSNLSLIVMSYMNPLKAALRSSVFLSSFTLTISPEDLHAIFSNVEVLLKVHATVLGEFEMLVDKWPVIEDVGAIFLRKASDLRVYGEYVRNFQTALHTLTRLQEENSKFSQFVSERMHRNYGDPGLMSLISCPLNQISQYSILLERLVNVTPLGHGEYEKLTAASMLMKEIYKMLQDSIEQTNNSAKLMDFQRRIMPHSIDFEVVVPTRMFVCEGAVLNYRKKKKRQCHYALFNDMFLLCRVKKNLLKVKYHFPHSQIAVEEDLLPTLLPPGIDTSTTPACGLVVPKDKLVLLFNSKQEYKVFLNKAKPLSEQANPTKRGMKG